MITEDNDIVSERLSSEQASSDLSINMHTPFQSVINKMIQIDEIESPMCKLEHIYKCCTSEI